MLKKVLHTGRAVADLEAAVALYESVGFTITKRFHKPDLNADVVMVTKGDTTFELFKLHEPDHPQAEYIRDHVAFYSDALEDDVRALTEQGYRVTIPITEGVVFRFAYLQDAAGANYEIATDKAE